MKGKLDNKQVLNEIILGYRNVIKQRYDFDKIKELPDFPDTFTEENVDKFKNYFLNLYPLPEKREELNEAFESLNGYIRQPDKLLRIIVDSSSLLFKFGRHLPKILKTAIKAMRSFQRTNDFEEKLVKNAIQLNLQPPFAKPQIEQLIKRLSRQEIEEFIESNIGLFDTLNDTVLVTKIQTVIETMINKMKNRPDIYSHADINGLKIGHELIVDGGTLFNQLSKKEQKLAFDFIIKTERQVLSELFEN